MKKAAPRLTSQNSQRLIFTAGCLVLVLAFAAMPARAVVIDTYSAVKDNNTDDVTDLAGGFGQSVDFVIAPAVTDPLGSRRRMEATQFGGAGSVSVTIDGNGQAAFTSTGLNSSANWNILYGVGIIGMNFDATAGGATQFRLNFTSFTPSLEYVIAAFSQAGGGTSANGTYQPINSNVIDVPFSGFSNLANIDFTKLTEIDLRIRDGGLSHNGQAQLTQFQTVPVPEPSTFILGGLGVLGLGLFCAAENADGIPIMIMRIGLERVLDKAAQL